MSDLSPREAARRANIVALNMTSILKGLDLILDDLLGTREHQIIVLLGAGDVVQYASTVPRKEATKMMEDLFARWNLEFDSYLPGERTPGKLDQFRYLLAKYEKAKYPKHQEPDAQDVANAKLQLEEYVGRLTSLEGRK